MKRRITILVLLLLILPEWQSCAEANTTSLRHRKKHSSAPLQSSESSDAEATPTPHFGYGAAEKSASDDSSQPAPSQNKVKQHPKAAEKTPAPQKQPSPESADEKPAVESTPTPIHTGGNATVPTSAIVEFAGQSKKVRQIIEFSLGLAAQNITYGYGSGDPAGGTLDCSGFIYYTLRQNGFPDVPRDASSQYVWARKAGTFRAVIGRSPDSFELNELRPGDLLFWVGTYATEHEPPISHVMIYLGTEASTNHRIMVGSSNGRTYHGKKRNGVSVFDFTIPQKEKAPGSKADSSDGGETVAPPPSGSTFVGYAHIPHCD